MNCAFVEKVRCNAHVVADVVKAVVMMKGGDLQRQENAGSVTGENLSLGRVLQL